jgi:nucleoside-diphosphate-sugar epimerase
MILVTGGDGFVGRHVCSVLSKHGKGVVATDRSFPQPVPCETVTGDLTDDAFLAMLFDEQSVQVIVHLASLLNTASGQMPQEALRVNVGSSLRLLEAAARVGTRRFVYGSSISVYGALARGLTCLAQMVRALVASRSERVRGTTPRGSGSASNE